MKQNCPQKSVPGQVELPSNISFKIRLSHFFHSSIVTSCLIFVAITLGILWYQAKTFFVPPNLTNYDWEQHPNTLLISIPQDDCHCGLSISEWINEGLSHRLDVLVLYGKHKPELDKIQGTYPQHRVTVLANVDQNIIKKFSPQQELTAVRVQHGRITHRFEGGLPSSAFWR